MANNQKKKKSQKLKPGVALALKIALIVFIAITLIFFAARMLGGITLTSVVENIKISISNLGAGDGYPYSVEGTGIKKAFVYSDKLFTFADDRTLLLSSSAKELSTETIEYGSPVIDFKDGKAVVYDTDSGKLRIQNTSKVVSTSELKNKITCAAIGEKGNFAVSCITGNNQTVFTAFNKSQEEIFTWNFASELVTCIDLSSDGKYAVVGTVKSENAETDSKVYVFKFDSEEYVSCFDFNQNVVISVRYVKSHDIEVITDKQRAYITDNSTKATEHSFESNTLHDISHIDSRYTAISMLKYGSDSNVVVDVYDRDEKIYSVDLGSSAKAVSVNERYMAVLTDSKITIYNKKGEIKAEMSADVSANDIVVSNKKVYMITPVEIICMPF
ncbi:MAG: hypothetical protein IJZ57_08945 [Clostridia bacterium]|nr:hypothetical protein [Clostridia bacterium]